MEKETNNLLNLGVDVQIRLTSAVYLCLAITIPIVIYFISKKYIV